MIRIERWKGGRFWAVILCHDPSTRDPDREWVPEELICVCVYRKGAEEVARRLRNA
jgi:hypothetical protein